MTPTERTVAHLRIVAERAAAHHAARLPRCEVAIARWLRRRDAYWAARQALPPTDPRSARAESLAMWAARRADAWTALGGGDAALARQSRSAAAHAFRAAMAVRVP